MFERDSIRFKFRTSFGSAHRFGDDASERLQETRHLNGFELHTLVDTGPAQGTSICPPNDSVGPRCPNQASLGRNLVTGCIVRKDRSRAKVLWKGDAIVTDAR